MATEITLDAQAAIDPTTSTKPIGRYLRAGARILMGLTFFVFGLNGFLNFIPQPSTPQPDAVVAFSVALLKTGYMFPLIKGTEVVAGALLLSNRLVPLALALLAPIIVNIVAVHAFLAPDGLAIAIVVLCLEIYLAWSFRKAYRPMLALRATAG